MKIVLISMFGGIHSLGIRYLSSVLKKEGHNITLIFLPRPYGKRGDFDDIINPYKKETLMDILSICQKADFIGLSVMTNYFFRAREITNYLKKSIKKPIVWGGIHPTVEPDECLEYADIVCRGEGEEAFNELINKVKNSKNYFRVKNFYFKINEKIFRNDLRPLNQNLDSLSFPDYDLKSHYILENKRIIPLTKKILEEKMPEIPDKKGKLLKAYPIFCTRGCPHGCNYCCNNALRKLYNDQKYIRRRSVKNIIDELRIIKKKFPFIRAVRIEDDSFLVAPTGEIINFSKEYKKNINLPFICLSSPINVNDSKIKVLIDAGMIGIQLGIQSGSDRVNKLIYNRQVNASQVLEAANTISRYQNKLVPTRFDIITDNPWENKTDIIKTIRLLNELPGKYILNLYSLVFYPGTFLFQKAKTEGLITSKKEIYLKDWLKVKMNYLKFLIFLNRFSTFKLPKKTINFLIKPEIIKIGEKFNFLFNTLYNLIYLIRLRLPF